MRAFCSNLVFSQYDSRNPACRKKKLQEIISILESLRSAHRSAHSTASYIVNEVDRRCLNLVQPLLKQTNCLQECQFISPN